MTEVHETIHLLLEVLKSTQKLIGTRPSVGRGFKDYFPVNHVTKNAGIRA